MSPTEASRSQVVSARPDMTAALMEQTGLDEAVLTNLVHRFYEKVRADPTLGPIFAMRIEDWASHLERMVAFWSSVALMTGRYHGSPVAAHMGLPVTWSHFQQWLSLFRETALEICPPEGAAFVIERAERIAHSLFLSMEPRSDEHL